MGFATIASAVTSAFRAYGDYQQAGALKAQAKVTSQAGDAQAKLLERDAAANDAVALQNDRMQRRNARSELAAVRADNAVSNLVADGTGLEREIDMATRLEREINVQTDDALRRSSNMRTQAAYTRWDSDMMASSLRRQAHGSNISALGNLASSLITLGGGAWDKWKTDGAAKKAPSPGGANTPAKK